MRKNDIETRLAVLDSKLNRLLTADSSATTSPYTLHGWLDCYIKNYKSPILSAKWRGVLSCNVERIKQLTQDKPLNEYSPADFASVINAVPYHYTKQVVYNLLRSAYDCAITNGYATVNPLYTLPPVKHYRRKGHALTIDEQAQLFEILTGDKYETLYKFYLLSGCRSAEALAIKWQDIDYNSNRIHIHGTKTYSSDRFIPLFPQIAELLKGMPRNGEYIFPYSVNQVRGHFYRITRKHGLQFHLHDLRHTFTTRCIESGISIFTLSKWLGHCSITVTANVYSHVLTAFEQSEIAKFNPKI